MATTTTIYKIVITELIKNGFNYFRDPKTNKIIYLSENSLMNKILKYDEDVDDVVNKVFFNNNYLSDTDSDVAFKYLWLSRFLNREIKFQSLALFSAKNTALFYQNANIILSYFKDFDKYLTNYSENKQATDNDSKTNFVSGTKRNDNNNQNSIYSSLPQTEINLNTSDESLSFADTNTISKNKTESESKTESENETKGKASTESTGRNYDLNKLILYKESNLLDKILDDFDKNCFLQIW